MNYDTRDEVHAKEDLIEVNYSTRHHISRMVFNNKGRHGQYNSEFLIMIRYFSNDYQFLFQLPNSCSYWKHYYLLSSISIYILVLSVLNSITGEELLQDSATETDLLLFACKIKQGTKHFLNCSYSRQVGVPGGCCSYVPLVVIASVPINYRIKIDHETLYQTTNLHLHQSFLCI